MPARLGPILARGQPVGRRIRPGASAGAIQHRLLHFSIREQLSVFRRTQPRPDSFPIQWERIQPSLHGPLDPDYLGLLKKAIGWSKAHGGKLIIDVHNFARYSINETGALNTYVIGPTPVAGTIRVTGADLADLWLRMSTEFQDDDAVYAYDIITSPRHGPRELEDDFPGGAECDPLEWRHQTVMIPGDSWSSANRCESAHTGRRRGLTIRRKISSTRLTRISIPTRAAVMR